MNYTNMLLESAEEVFKVIKDRNKYSIDETKILIAAANTLQQTAKTYIQAQVIETKLYNTKANSQQMIGTILNED